MVTLAILILFLVAALTLLYVYQHGHRSNLKKGRKPFQGMPQAGVLIKQATAAILFLNIIWLILVWLYGIPDIAMQYVLWSYIIAYPSIFVSLFVVLGTLTGPLRQMDQKMIWTGWQRHQWAIIIVLTFVIYISLWILYEACSDYFFALGYTILIFEYTDERPNEGRYVYTFKHWLTSRGRKFIHKTRAINREDMTREGANLLYYVQKSPYDLYIPYEPAEFRKEVEFYNWYQVWYYESEKHYEGYEYKWHVFPETGKKIGEWLKKYQPGRLEYMNHREEVINKFYDHPKFQDREYYSTLTGIYEDNRKRNIWGNLVEWPIRQPGHMQSLADKMKRPAPKFPEKAAEPGWWERGGWKPRRKKSWFMKIVDEILD